ncbi:MAG TPA: hemerythrin domain-containing protein [Micropepsaceae bacterium]|nr:hemerythrin domain-containing protein [Micropepsaceae bacterium]
MPLGTSTHTKGHAPVRPKSTKTQAKQRDAIKLLMADHDEVKALFKQFQKSKDGDARKAGIVEQICKALTVHAEIEEEIFYPAARDALAEKGEDMLDEAEVEHASIKSLVEQLQEAQPGDEMYDAKVKVLCEYVNHHVKEEEGQMFPKIKKTGLDLQELGAELLERKTELMGEEG